MLRVRVYGKEIDIPKQVFDQIITTKFYKNPHWSYSKLLTEDEVTKFLNGDNDSTLLKKVAYYILTYAENLTFATCILLYSESKSKAESYFKEMLRILIALRSIYRKVVNQLFPRRELIELMLNICSEVGIDPF